MYVQCACLWKILLILLTRNNEIILYIIRRKIFQRQSYRCILKLSIAIDVLLNNTERDKAYKLDT